jgi:hypothetical protein
MRIRSRDAEVPTSGDLDQLLAFPPGVRAEHQCEPLRQELSSRDDQLEALRENWEDVTQRVSQVLLDYLDRKHDAH